MMDVAGSVVIGTLLLVLVVVVWKRSVAATHEFPFSSVLRGGTLADPCPPEIVSRIFSDQDREFVSATHSKSLMKFFIWERRAVALLWIQETSAEIKEIIRDHVALTRRTQNLEFRAELSIFLQYIHLRLICALLFFLVVLAGPPIVQSLALYVDRLSQRFGQTQEALAAAMEQRRLSSADSD
jgi:hypothetical protein